MSAGQLAARAATCTCSVAAAGVVAASPAELPALREQPGGPVPPRFLRHSDEQTVVGLAAVMQALAAPPLRGQGYDDWGVVAAPVFPGRLSGAGTFTKFREGGCAAISPHIIPQNSLHSVAGAISICLGMHGPNFGIGGGPDSLAEGLTVALSLVDQSDLPGLWLVLTQWSPEPVPDGRGGTQTETTCQGVALALRPASQPGLSLQMTLPGSRTPVGPAMFNAADAADATIPQASKAGRKSLEELARWLTSDVSRQFSAPWSFDLPWGGRVELVQEQYQQQAKAA